jgi:hypothetical protein
VRKRATTFLAILRDDMNNNTKTNTSTYADDDLIPSHICRDVYEFRCPTCDADVHEFCTYRDKYNVKREITSAVHKSRSEAAGK